MLKRCFLTVVVSIFISEATVLTLQQGVDGYDGCITTDIRDISKAASLEEDGGSNPNKVTLADGG